MILRKPYAFLIKYFKLIHVLLVLPMCYLLYRTNVIFNFFQEYIGTENIVVGRDFTGELFNSWMFVLPFITIVVLGILLGVMFYKKKPKIYYLYNILTIIAILVIYNIGYDAANTLEAQALATRTLYLNRDLFMILMLLQGISVILTFIRATGFDIKKFDFNKDLEDLDITEADAEEFEVDLNVETNVFKRELRKNIRYAKYIYVENKYIINGIFLITFSVICFIIYMNLTIYNKTYKQGQAFSTRDFNITINNSYLTNQNYAGEEITDNYLVVVELDLKAHYDDTKLNTAKVGLSIDDVIYYPNNKYNSSLIDLGEIYSNRIIDNKNFASYILVYEIPRESISEKMVLKYLDSLEAGRNKLNPKYIKIKLEPYNLDENLSIKKTEKNSFTGLNEMLLKKTSINIIDFEIQDKFKLDYKYCNKTNCYDSVEYLNPVLNTNYDKVLLKIDGQINLDENLNNKNIYDLYTIINTFGKLRYEINGQTKYFYPLNKVTPKKAKATDSYYIEIPKQVMESEKIELIIDIRNVSYEYIIK